MSGLFGFIAFILALFCAGALMEENMKKAGVFAAAFLVCALIVVSLGGHGASTIVQRDCWIDWDGFSNSEVCD